MTLDHLKLDESKVNLKGGAIACVDDVDPLTHAASDTLSELQALVS